MFLVFEDRPSDSPFIERVWRCHSERAGSFLSVASSNWEMVVTRHDGRTSLTLRGPETKATAIDCVADGEWFGIRFKLGSFMPQLPVTRLLDRNDVTLSDAAGRAFWLDGETWEYPGFENAEVFVSRLVKNGLITHDPAVEAALQGDRRAMSPRSAQRHFVQAMGISHNTFRQIERARRATNMLKHGVSIMDTVHDAGFYDQAHLTRSLQRLIGQTPGKIIRGAEQLSFLYNTTRGR